jgi:4-amino-4-deoxy-L-arabinose transferase-like glycosyltransferase
MPVFPRSFWRSPLAFALLAGLCALTLLFRLGSYGLVDPDEGRYAEIPREMLARGDWITPTLNGVKFFDKPVLPYWSVMASYSLLGVSEFAARLSMVAFALAGIAATYALGRRAFGPRAGWLGAAILATTLMWPVMGRMVITDTPLAALTTCALATWWLGHTTRFPNEEAQEAAPIAGMQEAPRIKRARVPLEKRRRLWFALFWGFVGLGVLSKGPVAVVLCFGAIVPYLLWCRPKNGWQMGFSWGVPLMLLVAAPWFVAVQIKNSEFNHLFWYLQNVARFTGGAGVPDHWEKPWYFLPLLPLIFFPWTPFFPRALASIVAVFRRARLGAQDEAARAVVFLVCGSLFVLLFFSLSKSKIVTYILPLVPLGCALLGAWFDANWKRGERLRIETAILSLLALVLATAAFVSRGRVEKLLHFSSVPWLPVVGAVALLWALALGVAAWRGKASAIGGATGGGFALLLASGLLFWGSIESAVTLPSMMQRVQQAKTSDTQIASIGFIQSLSFYGAPRRIIVNGIESDHDKNKIPDELKPGWERMRQAERDLYFYGDVNGLKRLLARPNPVFVVARSRTLEDPQWKSVRNSARVLGSNSRFTLYGNDAAARRFSRH